MKPKPRPLRSVSRPGEARRVTRSQSLDTERASATLWLSGECHFGIATLQTKTQTLSNPVRVRGLWFYLVRHWLLLNRGGKEVKMPSGYDEMTDRAFADYAGGTPEERARRALLRQAMEKQDFQVIPKEWWHFDYKDWKQYPILNVKFEDLGR